MSHAISVDTALSLDTTAVKWPFAPQVSGSRKPERSARQPAAMTPAAMTPAARTPAAMTPSVHASTAMTAGLRDAVGVSGSSHDAEPADHFDARSIHSMSMAALAQHAQVGRRQMILDVGLVLMWAGLIPAMLWLGHAAGY